MKHMQLVLDFLIFSFKMAGDTGGRGGHGPALFCIENRKRGNKGEKEKLLKGCHEGPNAAALAILGRLEFKKVCPYVLADHTILGRQFSMVPPL